MQPSVLPDVLGDLTVGVLLAVVSAAMGWAGAMLRRSHAREAEAERRQSARDAALLCLLRSYLESMHARYVVDGAPCPVAAKDAARDAYAAYHELGGNGTGTHLYEEIREAPVGGRKGRE